MPVVAITADAKPGASSTWLVREKPSSCLPTWGLGACERAGGLCRSGRFRSVMRLLSGWRLPPHVAIPASCPQTPSSRHASPSANHRLLSPPSQDSQAMFSDVAGDGCYEVYCGVCRCVWSYGRNWGGRHNGGIFLFAFWVWKTQLAHPYLAVQASRARDIGS